MGSVSFLAHLNQCPFVSIQLCMYYVLTYSHDAGNSSFVANKIITNSLRDDG